MKKRHPSYTGTKKASPRSGGYAKDRKPNVSAKKNELTQPIVIKKRKPLPKGIADALRMMAILAQELDEMTTVPNTVSIDVVDDQWVLVVRGYEPPFDMYGGYPVKFINSAFIRNPLSGMHPKKGNFRPMR